MYLAWALFCEGITDRSYLEVLIPRVLEDLLLRQGNRPVDIARQSAVPIGQRNRRVDAVAAEVCAAQEAFHLLFIHADTGARALHQNLDNRGLAYCQRVGNLCDWPPSRCIVIAPRHETEAWTLADADAVANVLGYNGDPGAVGLPGNAQAAERLQDPKARLNEVIARVRGRRRRDAAADLFPAIAERQLFVRLRRAKSFMGFEQNVVAGLTSLGLLQ